MMDKIKTSAGFFLPCDRALTVCDTVGLPRVQRTALLTPEGYALPDHIAVTRPDGSVIAVNSDQYEVVDPRDAVSSLDPIVDSGRGSYAGAGSLYDDRRWFVTVKLDARQVCGQEAEYRVHMVGSHDRSLQLSVRGSIMILVCRNTLASMLRADEGGFKTRHTRGANKRIYDAGTLLAQAIANFSNVSEVLENLRTKRVTWAQFEALAKSVLRVKAHRAAPPFAGFGRRLGRA